MLLNDENQIIISADKSVKLLPYRPREPIPFSLMSDEEIAAGAGGILIFDSECFKNYFLIAFKDTKTKKIILFIPPFNQFKLSWIMHNYTCVGFNSLKYDLPLLWLSYVTQDTRVLKEASNALINGMWYKELQKEFNFTIHPTATIDLIEVAPLRGSLKLYGARLHAKRIQDVPWGGNNSLEDWQIPVTQDYCINDLDTTELLFDFMKERLALRADISARYKEDVMSKSDPQIAEAIICKEIMNRTGKYPKKSNIKEGYSFNYDVPSYIKYTTPVLQQLLADIKESAFVVNEVGGIDRPATLNQRTVNVGDLVFSFGIGGLHSCEKCIAYKADDENLIVDRDVTAYYPDILLTLGLYPESIGPMFLDIYGGFKAERVAAKRNKQFTYDKGLKIFINGASGKLNQKDSRLYSPKSYIQMTLTGQFSILMLTELLVTNGIKVISGNTDGIVIYCKKLDYKKLEQIIKFWEQETKFNTEETRYKAYYAKDVNSYFALKLDDSVKVKGTYAEVGSQSGTQLDTNCATLICSDAVKLLLSKNIPVEKTIRECQDITRFVEIRNVKGGAHKDGNYLGKVIRWIYLKEGIGTINYILTGNKVANTDTATPLMDLPDEFPTNINFDWYIQRANEMLEDVGYYAKSKQVVFF